jgi:2,5-furandicarboxylate decarboxylase 1
VNRQEGLTMPYQDLRAFLTALKDAGELVEIARPVSPKYDIAKALAKTSAIQGPALLFTQTGTDFPLIAGWRSRRSRRPSRQFTRRS